MVGKKLVFAGIGVVCACIGVVGVILPGVPGVLPLIIALWAFSRSSTRLRRRLESLSLLEAALVEADRFERERSVDLRVKKIAIGSAWLSTLLIGIITQHVLIVSVAAAMAVACTIFMLYIPTRRSVVLSYEEGEYYGESE